MFGIHQVVSGIFWISLVPALFIALWLSGVIAYGSLKLSLICCLIVFVLLPLLFKYSVTLQRNILFLTFVSFPKNLDFQRPDIVGLYGTRNFYIKLEDSTVPKNFDKIKIGVWHILPAYVVKRFRDRFHLNTDALNDIENVTDIEDPYLDKAQTDLKNEFPFINEHNEELFFEKMLRQPGTIVLYLHGNTSSRGAPHRVDMYKVLRKLGYHVLALDYRGYGDSDKVPPTEEGVIRDSLAVYDYIQNLTNNPVFLWGHSLGTGVSTHLLSILQQMNVKRPRAVVLESPFTNIMDEIREHPFSSLFRNLPWFEYTISRPMYSNSFRFESDKHITEFRQPVMILHAEDDIVVPFQLGYSLYRTAVENRGKSWGPVEFHRFEATSRYGHKFICRAPNLPEIVSNFFKTYRSEIY